MRAFEFNWEELGLWSEDQTRHHDWHHCSWCVSTVRAGQAFRIRLPAEQVLVYGWEMVHGPLLQHMVVVLSGHGTVEHCVPGNYIPHRTAGCHLVHGAGSKSPSIYTARLWCSYCDASMGPTHIVHVVPRCEVHPCFFQPSADDPCMICDIPYGTVKVLVHCLVTIGVA